MPRFIIIILQSVALTMVASVYGNPTIVSNGTLPMSTTALDFMKMQRAAAAADLHADTPLLRRNLQKIIGGETAGKGEFPWFGLTQLTVKRRFRAPLFFNCGGSFIHSDIVISAAHCFLDLLRAYPRANFQLDVYVGYDLSTNTFENAYKVSDIYWSQSYSFPIRDDIVFYKVTNPTSVPPVSWNTDPLIPLVGDVGTAIGYGFITNDGPISDTLQKVTVPVISNAQCGEYYNFEAENSLVCTFTEGKSICSGDSGGPILTRSGVLFGLTSFLSNLGCDQGPSGFTRVSTYSDMIASVSVLL